MNLKNRPILKVPSVSNSVHIIVPSFIQQSTEYRLLRKIVRDLRDLSEQSGTISNI